MTIHLNTVMEGLSPEQRQRVDDRLFFATRHCFGDLIFENWGRSAAKENTGKDR